MIDLDEIKQFFPEAQQKNPLQYEYMLKEYFHYRILDLIFSGKQAGKLSFIGGTNLRIVHRIGRFSEDLDFDYFNLERDEFMEMTDEIIDRLSLEGIDVRADDKEKDRALKAFRRNLIFPGLMYNLGLSQDKLVRLAAKGEKVASRVEHADNVAPALLGGFVIVHRQRIISLNPENIGIVAVHPDIIVNTRRARAILPKKLSLEDISFNTASAASMVVGIMQEDISIIGKSMENRKIEESRSRLIKGYKHVRKNAMDAGATGVTISGSGPTMIAVCEMDQREYIAEAMKKAFSNSGVKSEAYITTIGKGAEIIG